MGMTRLPARHAGQLCGRHNARKPQQRHADQPQRRQRQGRQGTPHLLANRRPHPRPVVGLKNSLLVGGEYVVEKSRRFDTRFLDSQWRPGKTRHGMGPFERLNAFAMTQRPLAPLPAFHRAKALRPKALQVLASAAFSAADFTSHPFILPIA